MTQFSRRSVTPTPGETVPVDIPADSVLLQGDLTLPEGAEGLVIFAHGSGSSRFSPRNRHVAAVLQQAGLGTLLLDSLTPQEEALDQITAGLRFDLDLLRDRLIAAAEWASSTPATAGLCLGLFGSSTGGGAALLAAAARPDLITTVVSRGGRPDLAGPALPQVECPVLLLVGGEDHGVIELNEEAAQDLRCEKELVIIPGATHLFEEPGKLDEVAGCAAEWFATYLHH
ncbi:MAG TPA: dienelactone hydrolase family protein [Candidatus Thermoplasmatota archaeon]|nr:dienelactone hydrolase family protein [Candidatus Thermoplasmatota archaeon]